MGGGGNRDFTLILVAYRHSLRAREICELEWSQVEFGRSAALHVRRVKNGKPSVHPIRGDELRMLTALRREFPNNGYVFTSERGTPFTTDAVNRLLKTIGKRAKLSLLVHCHMLRHACGYALANRGIDTRAIQDWLGHVSITHTTEYTELTCANASRMVPGECRTTISRFVLKKFSATMHRVARMRQDITMVRRRKERQKASILAST
jgi:integrase